MTDTNNSNYEKNDKDELLSILLACGVFTLALLIVDFTYGNMEGLIHSWIKIPFIVVHILLFIGWIAAINYRGEPNLDWVRKAVIALAIAGLLLILSHRAGWLSEKMFQEDVDKNKQEQNAN